MHAGAGVALYEKALIHYACERHELKELINICLCEINDAVFITQYFQRDPTEDNVSLSG